LTGTLAAKQAYVHIIRVEGRNTKDQATIEKSHYLL
jgi:hypothetical protein